MIGLHLNQKGAYALRRDENPIRRENPSGAVRWIARYTGRDGKRRSAGTFAVEGPCRRRLDDGTCCAKHAILAAYEAESQPEAAALPVTVRAYFEETWLQRHPRPERTEAGYRRLNAVMDAPTQDGPLGGLAMDGVRPRHLDDLVDHMLRVQGRAAGGARQIVGVISTMFIDAIRDEKAEVNPAAYITIRDSDPRVRKPKRRKVILSWAQMHEFAAAAGRYEAMIRVFSDCGPRLGEVFALERVHDCGEWMLFENKAWRGRVSEGTKSNDGRTAPIGPGLRAILDAYATPLHGPLFPSPSGKVWTDRDFYRVVWNPAREASGLAVTPHMFRHSFTSLMRAAGVDPADLAKATGHTVATATAHYTHSTGATFDAMRRAVG